MPLLGLAHPPVQVPIPEVHQPPLLSPGHVRPSLRSVLCSTTPSLALGLPRSLAFAREQLPLQSPRPRVIAPGVIPLLPLPNLLRGEPMLAI